MKYWVYKHLCPVGSTDPAPCHQFLVTKLKFHKTAFKVKGQGHSGNARSRWTCFDVTVPSTLDYSTMQELSFGETIYSPRGLGWKSPSEVQGRSPGRRSGPWETKLKQFAGIVYRFWLQKRLNLNNFTQSVSWFSTSTFHSGGWLSHIFRAYNPLAHAWYRHYF